MGVPQVDGLDKVQLDKEQQRARHTALNHISTLGHLVTPKIAETIKPQFKALATRLLTADELQELADNAKV